MDIKLLLCSVLNDHGSQIPNTNCLTVFLILVGRKPIIMSNKQSVTDLDSEHVFTILAHEYRREILSRLIETGESIPVGELAEYIATAVEPTGDIQNGALQHRIAIHLHHTHLPKLVDANLITVESDSEMITATPTLHALKPYLHDASTRPISRT